MNALVAKEIRLLLPAYGLALLLAVVPVWLLPNKDNLYSDLPGPIVFLPFWFGSVMLALSAFGREFGLQTFPLLLAQPLERQRIWWTKVTVLAGAMATVFVAGLLSCLACIGCFGPGQDAIFETLMLGGRGYYFGRGASAWLLALQCGGMTVILTFAGGLWATLLLRQVAAAFWFTLLFPGAMVTVIGMNGGSDTMMLVALGLYSVAGFMLARWLFFRAQDVSWTGSVIAFPGWRVAEAAPQTFRRSYRPRAALLGKELQLHQVGLVGMGLLFLLHLGVVAVRRAGPDIIGDMLYSSLGVFGVVWLIVPVLAGSQSVAEERKLGTITGQLCLPVSRREQFDLKLLVVLVLDGLLSAVLLWTAESIGSAVGAGSTFAELKIPFNSLVLICLGLIFPALSLIGFYASTLARNLVQALAIAVVMSFGVLGIGYFASHLPEHAIRWLGRGGLLHYIAWPTLMATFVGLAWCNFRSGSESWRLWRRNVLGLAGALVFIGGFTTAIYHRAWEWLMPLEPAHGPARLTLAKPPILRSYYDDTQLALLPDGRLWVNYFFCKFDVFALVNVMNWNWTSLSGNRFEAGSNWVDAVANYRDTVAIRSDGTLWVSEKPRLSRYSVAEPAQLIRFGEETHWQQVVSGDQWSVILLKQDGTLWRWGATNANDYRGHTAWPGLRAIVPQRLGTASDWARILWAHGRVFAWSRDGRAWQLGSAGSGLNLSRNPGRELFWPCPSFDNLKWRSLIMHPHYPVGVREDGTLWASETMSLTWDDEHFLPEMVRIGRDTDWVAVTGYPPNLAVLKGDGSLWTWDYDYKPREQFVLADHPLVRLGTHTDWVAVSFAGDGIISLAADGSLWYWENRYYAYYSGEKVLLAASRKPAKIENIFDHEE